MRPGLPLLLLLVLLLLHQLCLFCYYCCLQMLHCYHYCCCHCCYCCYHCCCRCYLVGIDLALYHHSNKVQVCLQEIEEEWVVEVSQRLAVRLDSIRFDSTETSSNKKNNKYKTRDHVTITITS